MITYDMVLISIAVLIGIVVFWFWISMAVHCFKNRQLSRENRYLWLFAIIFGKLLGAGAYYYLKYRRTTLMAA